MTPVLYRVHLPRHGTTRDYKLLHQSCGEYQEGKAAYLLGVGIDRNPYRDHEGHEDHASAWQSGWLSMRLSDRSSLRAARLAVAAERRDGWNETRIEGLTVAASARLTAGDLAEFRRREHNAMTDDNPPARGF